MERVARNIVPDRLNMSWMTEGVTKESVKKQLKLNRKYKSKFYKWQLARKISKLERKADKEQNPMLKCNLLLEIKKHLDELTRCAK